jgi:DNA-binding NtrC family response regulator
MSVNAVGRIPTAGRLRMDKARILLVDDDPNLVTTFKSILQREGYHVETAGTGQQALKKADKSKFDLAILDIRLPDITGDEVAKLMKKTNDGTRFVLITGHSYLQDCIDALDLGIYEILLKPVAPEEIIRAAKEALKQE